MGDNTWTAATLPLDILIQPLSHVKAARSLGTRWDMHQVATAKLAHLSKVFPSSNECYRFGFICQLT
jgi:hypothetical protein